MLMRNIIWSKYAKFLSEENELNNITSPSIDMGKAPHLFSYKDSVSQQIFTIPNCVYPHFVCIKYHEICPYYKMRDEKYKNSCFDIFGITHDDVIRTWSEANKLLSRTRGRVAWYELTSYILICGVWWFVLALSIALGILINFIWGVLIFFIYICFVGNFILCTRRRK